MRRMNRTVLPAALLVTTLSLAMLAPAAAIAAPCWRPPVTGPIIDHFRAPGCPYCSGKRGIEFRTGSTAVARSVEAGVVTFSGSVAGTLYVVIEHTNGWKVTYGRLGDVHVERGQRVARGARLGTVSGNFYLGLRVSGEYRDPEPFLGQRVGRPRLVPVDGTTRRRAPTSTWVCRP